jgi:hypothetical protein
MTTSTVVLTFDEQPHEPGTGNIIPADGGDIAYSATGVTGGSPVIGFGISGGPGTTVTGDRPTGIASYPTGADSINTSWRWETNIFDVAQSQWALHPYSPGNDFSDVFLYIIDTQDPRSDITYTPQDNLSWTAGGAFNSWITMDNHYSWGRSFTTTLPGNAGSGEPLYWFALIDVFIYCDLLGLGTPSHTPTVASPGTQTTHMGTVELRLANSF